MATRRAGFVLGATIVALLASAGAVTATTPPGIDIQAGAKTLALDTAVTFDSRDATISPDDPTGCDGSHGPWPGPYSASVWFQYTATSRDHHLVLNAPTMQGDPNDFLAISFVYAKTPSGLQLIDCTAFGNDAQWDATAGTTYLIMEAGLSSAVTDDPEFSDKGGHGTVILSRLAPSDGKHYSWNDRFTYDDCGFRVDGVAWGSGMFTLKPGRHGDPTPYYFDNSESHVITTNPANGKWFREDAQTLYKDLHITNVQGTVYTFVSEQTGRAYTLTDMNGHRVYFDRGHLVTTSQVDTHGDDDLSNDEFIDGSFEILADNGDHSSLSIDDWCAQVVQPLLGD
jgi:hypothetical protein